MKKNIINNGLLLLTTVTHPRAGMLSEIADKWLKYSDVRFDSRKDWISEILSDCGLRSMVRLDGPGCLDLAAILMKACWAGRRIRL